MLTQQKNTILSVSALVLFFAAFLANDPFGLFEGGYDTSDPLLQGQPSSVESVTVANSGPAATPEGANSGFILKRNSNGWSLFDSVTQHEYPANAGKVENALRNTYQTRRFQVVSSDASKHMQFGTADNQFFITLKSTGGKDETIVHIGSQGGAHNSTLLRVNDEKEVYSVKGNLNNDWNHPADYFREKKLFQFEKENIRALSVKTASSYKLFQDAEGKWKITRRGASLDADPNRLSRLLADLAQVEGTSFFEGKPPKADFISIEIELNTGTSELLNVRKIRDIYLVKSVNNPYWMEIPEYRITPLAPDASELTQSQNQAGQ